MVFAVVAMLVSTPLVGCTLSVGALAFGSIDPLQAVVRDSAVTVEVRCDTPTAYRIEAGPGASGRFDARTLAGGGASLEWQLYVDAARTQVFGDGSAGTFVIDGEAGPTVSAHHAYGRIPHQPRAIPGHYVDVLPITIVY